jgi:hypothetical protein
MTIPWLHNCPHSTDAWCLDCVTELGEERGRLVDLLTEAAEWLKPDCGDRELQSLYGRIRRAVGTPTSET